MFCLKRICYEKNLLLAVCMAGVMVSFVSEAFGQSLPVYDTPDRSKIPAFRVQTEQENTQPEELVVRYWS